MNTIHADGFHLVEQSSFCFVIFTDSEATHTGQAVACVLMNKTHIAKSLEALGLVYKEPTQ